MNRLAFHFITGGLAVALGISAGCLAGSGGAGGSRGPRQCFPDGEVEQPEQPVDENPECSACIQQQCDFEADCGDPCEAFYACTCACDGDDDQCFGDCESERTGSCDQCIESSTADLTSCVQEECGGPCLGLASGGDGGGGDDGSANDGGGNDSGGVDDDGGGWDDGGDGSGWDDSGGDGGDGADGGDAGGDGGGGAACEELHATCCPQLDGIDLELCTGATDEPSCALWLDIFRGEGAC